MQGVGGVAMGGYGGGAPYKKNGDKKTVQGVGGGTGGYRPPIKKWGSKYIYRVSQKK